MSKNMPVRPDSISLQQIKGAIQRSGYLLEQRVEPVISQEGYDVETNAAFPDSDTGKTRELDINAMSAVPLFKRFVDAYDFIYPTLLCECENNLQPIVFFTSQSPFAFTYSEQVKVSGIPVKIWQEYGYVTLSEFTGMEKFHHYCKGVIATQYCNFQQSKKDKSTWLAFHYEEQHDTFNTLIKAVDYEIAKHFDDWLLPERIEEEGVDIKVYYPLIVLQGKLYYAEIKDNRLALRESKHVQFRKQFFSTYAKEVETYQIDVITEEFLPNYLKIVESEIKKVRGAFQRKKSDVLLSIGKIVKEAKKVKGKPKSYRQCLEF